MTLDQILAAGGVVVPLIVTMISMHIQNLLRGDRQYRSILALQDQVKRHERKTGKMRKRLERIEQEISRHAQVYPDITAPAPRQRTS